MLILTGILLFPSVMVAQRDNEAAYKKLLELTSMFHGLEPYSCYAILEVKYRDGKPVRDTSMLIYRNGQTYYKSRRVEHVESSVGELIINHELRTADLHLSDSIRQVLFGELDLKPDKELESMLDSNFQQKELQYFNDYVVNHCNAAWETKDGVDEISFTPKDRQHATLLSMKLRFKGSTLLYYEYTYRDVYSSDIAGNAIFRTVRTIYDNFKYEQVPNISSRLSDFLEWKGWTVKLKIYTNYKLSVL